MPMTGLFANDDDQFKLDESFIDSYKGTKPNFGFNGLGEFIFYRTYSRLKEDKTKETFLDTCRRVVEGCFEIQRRHQRRCHLPWDHHKAQPTAQEMFDRMWSFKFLPPGRGLWMMGTPFMWKSGSAALCNCGFCSTSDEIETDPAEPFCFLMDMSMLGVGIGFDTKGAGRIKVFSPGSGTRKVIISDDREGWVDSVRQLIRSYTTQSGMGHIEFDYSLIRPEGTEIKGFGGKAAGPSILADLHEMIRVHLESKVGSTLSSVDITDIMNYIGRCVVAGNVRRSAEVAFGYPDDEDYCNMKNPVAPLEEHEKSTFFDCIRTACAKGRYEVDASDFEGSGIPYDRLSKAIAIHNAMNHHRWASNNSILATVGMDYTGISDKIMASGEPGLIWLDNMRDYGRMIDGKHPGIDGRVMGANPCIEQSLESYELCNLCELFPANHDDSNDFTRTLKFAYLYAKTVTLLPTHNARTNQVTLRNRRIGLSQSGIVQAFEKFGRRTVLRDFCDTGYNEVRRWDDIYSEWLCVSRSIKVTSVKPSGSISLLTGATPGVHYPEAQNYWRRVRISKNSTLIPILAKAGFHIEQAANDDHTVIAKFAIANDNVRSVDDVSIWEQVANVVDYQRYWSDNQVSCTIKFKPECAGEIQRVLSVYEDQLKGISFLPIMHSYAQAPYESCTAEEVAEYNSKLGPTDYSEYIYEAAGEKYCDTDSCDIMAIMGNKK